MNQEITTTSVDELKKGLFFAQYQNLIQYMENDETKARKFLSAVVSCFSNTPSLAECTRESLISAFMKIAEFDMFPSNVSGQAYVLPYKNFQKKVTEAQFQLGYQGLVTLFYRAGAKAIRSEIVRQCDIDQERFSYINGIVRHTPDVFNPERHKSPAVGAYVIIDLPTGGAIAKAMGKTEIFSIRDKFSKSKDNPSSPWNESKDPELWMWKKTVLKQVAKLVPKNERIIEAIEIDNKNDTDFEEIEQEPRKIVPPDLSKIIPPPEKVKEEKKEAEVKTETTEEKKEVPEVVPPNEEK